MAGFWVASLDVAYDGKSFVFEGAGTTPGSARSALVKALRAHEKKRRLRDGLRPGWYDETAVEVRFYMLDVSMRDGTQVTQGKESKAP